LEQDSQEAERLARPKDASNLLDFRTRYPHFRQYTPKFVGTFQFDGIPARVPLLEAFGGDLSAESGWADPGLRRRARSFVPAKWERFVFTDKGIDRCYYELCVLSELSLGLKSGDTWVHGSRRCRNLKVI
jgi:hypothetical protein